MKKSLFILLHSAGFLALAIWPVSAQSTFINYQGHLEEGTSPAEGVYDFLIDLYPVLTGGPSLGQVALFDVPVTHGLFTVDLDWSTNAFTGEDRWLGIQVRPVGGTTYTLLNPRQAVALAPHALYARSAGSVTPGQAVRSLNGLTDAVTLQAGDNIALTPLANGLEISNTGLSGSGADRYLPVFTGDKVLGSSSIYDALGSIGIGTASPVASMLHVKSAFAQPAVRIEGSGTGGLEGRIVFGSSGTSTYVSQAEANSLYVAAPNYIGLGPGKVGVLLQGSILATHSLNVASQDERTLRLLGPDGDFSHGAQINFGDVNYVLIKEDEDDKLLIHADEGTRFTGGNIGIGTTDPQRRLDVDGGDILVRGPGGFNEAGEQGTLFLGDANHYIKSEYAYGLTLGTYGVGDAVFIREGSGNVGIGTNSPGAKLEVAGTARVQDLQITGGADIAEPFPMSSDPLPRGAVVIIDDQNPGRLKMSDRAYDTRVAGIVSGANGVNPGLSLHQEGFWDGGQPVALTGRVYALADATTHPIRPGDLLTTSDTPGRLMKSQDRLRSQGAILGKAMTGLEHGHGMVLVLVSLQ